MWIRVRALCIIVSVGALWGMANLRYDEVTHLLSDQFRHFGIAVPEGIDSNARGEVKIAAVFNVPEVAAFALDHHGRGADVCCHHIGHVVIDDCSGLGVGGRIVVG